MFGSNIRTQVGICTPIPYCVGPRGDAIPENITVEWHRRRMAIATPTNTNTYEITIDGHEVGDARNKAVEFALTRPSKAGFIFFLDYDVLPMHDCLTKLLYRAAHFPDHDIFAGVYCCKTHPAEPLIYAGDGHGPFWDWTIGDLLTTEQHGITGTHMGLTLIRLSLFERLSNTEEMPWFKTTGSTEITGDGLINRYGTEDLWFCKRAIEEAKAKILVDTSVLAGHVNNKSGEIFGLPEDCKPVKGASWMPQHPANQPGGENMDADGQPVKKALDLGAGEHKRSWDGHKTFTTDLRADTKPDFVMDSRMLNLPAESFDLVASSHHLEHLGRWDQETVWREIFRICKAGGSIEHIVPNAEWAAAKMADGIVDEHVLNVLYGAQEEHGYARALNTHYFPYTPAIAAALAESAGFADVVVTSYKDDPSLGYNLVIRGKKPAAKQCTNGGETVAEFSAESPIDPDKDRWVPTAKPLTQAKTAKAKAAAPKRSKRGKTIMVQPERKPRAAALSTTATAAPRKSRRRKG